MVYKTQENDSWIRVPVNRDDLNELKNVLRREKKTLKKFIDEAIQKKLDRENSLPLG